MSDSISCLTESMNNLNINQSIENQSIDNQSIKNQSIDNFIINIVDEKNKQVEKRDIWKNSKWAHIGKFGNDDSGKVGESIVQGLCNAIKIESNINGIKTKQYGGGNGDGYIKGKTVEIKTAKQGNKTKSGKSNNNFQHELGENPWNAEYMLFLDITPEYFYITLFKNFTEEFYKSNSKCEPYFPTKTMFQRKKQGNFKLDTTIKINEDNVKRGYTFKSTQGIDKFKDYINSIIL
jgi:hypothetical protein